MKAPHLERIIIEEIAAIKEILREKNSVCCMKFRDPKGGWPLKYGVIYPEAPNKIFIREENERGVELRSLISKEVEKFSSIEAMYEAGWIVD